MALKENVLLLRIVELLQDYLSCKVKFLADNKRAWSGQLHLIENMEKKFDSWIEKILYNVKFF